MMSSLEPEQTFIRQWIASLYEAQPGADTPRLPQARPPLSFRCGEESSAEFFARAKRVVTRRASGDTTLHEFRYCDPCTGLVCILELTEYHDFPAVEWVVYLRNDSDEDSPLLQDIQALDLTWTTTSTARLHRSYGTDERINDFQFVSETMASIRSPRWSTRMTAGDQGRSSVDWLPFFHLETDEDGLVVAIGWSGQWAAEIERPEQGLIRLRAGMEHTHLRLRPGERIRSPRILLLYRRGDVYRGQNLLRQLILKHHTPHYDGQPLLAPACHSSWGGTPTARHLDFFRLAAEHGLRYDYYWVDAGWYGISPEPCPDVFTGDSWWKDVGDWRVNPYRHPEGLKPISEAAHRAGMKFLLWVEPERARHGAPITLEHPEWFLARQPDEPRQAGDNLLLNLGHPEALRWVTDLVSGLIAENGIDCYRQDFNMAPLPYWQANEAADRQGMAEIRHIEGLYAFWDALRAHHPHLLIDNCSSGGRRIDLETISRSIPLWRNDYNCFPMADPEVVQVHGAGLTHWVPLHATSPVNNPPGDTYRFRSALAAGTVFTLDEFALVEVSPNYPWEWHRRMLADYYRARPFWYGDYYPLTTCATAPDAWLAFQLHRPDQGAGLILAFRRAASPLVTAEFPLRGLDLAACYRFEDADSGEAWVEEGCALAEADLRLTIAARRASRLLFYTRLDPA